MVFFSLFNWYTTYINETLKKKLPNEEFIPSDWLTKKKLKK